jgi:hypothetical protein
VSGGDLTLFFCVVIIIQIITLNRFVLFIGLIFLFFSVFLCAARAQVSLAGEAAQAEHLSSFRKAQGPPNYNSNDTRSNTYVYFSSISFVSLCDMLFVCVCHYATCCLCGGKRVGGMLSTRSESPGRQAGAAEQ